MDGGRGGGGFEKNGEEKEMDLCVNSCFLASPPIIQDIIFEG